MKQIARIISAVSTPLFIPFYLSLLALIANKYAFGGMHFGLYFVIQIFIWTLAIPLIALAIMKGMNMSADISLPEREDRIIPFFLCLSCYSIAFYSSSQLEIPILVKGMLAGTILACVLGLFFTNFYRISIHSIGMGTLLGASCALVMFSVVKFVWFIPFVLLWAGVVMSIRVRYYKHNNREVFAGFLVGLFSQLSTFMLYTILLNE